MYLNFEKISQRFQSVKFLDLRSGATHSRTLNRTNQTLYTSGNPHMVIMSVVPFLGVCGRSPRVRVYICISRVKLQQTFLLAHSNSTRNVYSV